jgi:hypothetical protein
VSDSSPSGRAPVPLGSRRSCGGGCLKTVVGFAIIFGLLLLLEPVRLQIQARLQRPDYATGILTVSGGLALDFMAGVLLVGVMSVVAFTAKQPGFGTGAALLALVFLAIAVAIGTQTWLDVVSTPVTVRGTVNYHFVSTTRGQTTHYVQLNGVDYTTTPSVYKHIADGRCAVLTYGPRTKVVTATASCEP